MKIESLTKEQENKLPLYVKEWVQRGLTTVRQSQSDAERVFAQFQKLVLEKDPAPVVLLDSPADCAEYIKNKTGAKIVPYPYFDCQFWAGWFSYYEFMRCELGIKYNNEEKYMAFLACQPYGMVWPLDEVCVVCQPPTVIKRNEHGLHCDGGPAVSYNGKSEIYALNGVVVPKYLVVTPSEDLSLEFFTAEKNADVKAEFVRKYGVERMLELGKQIDTFENYSQTENPWWYASQYELYNMGILFDVEYQPYLKMRNQTTDIWHVEAVSPECRTLKDAIKERFGGRDMKILKIA